jgi:hypothetical protein
VCYMTNSPYVDRGLTRNLQRHHIRQEGVNLTVLKSETISHLDLFKSRTTSGLKAVNFEGSTADASCLAKCGCEICWGKPSGEFVPIVGSTAWAVIIPIYFQYSTKSQFCVTSVASSRVSSTRASGQLNFWGSHG